MLIRDTGYDLPAVYDDVLSHDYSLTGDYVTERYATQPRMKRLQWPRKLSYMFATQKTLKRCLPIINKNQRSIFTDIIIYFSQRSPEVQSYDILALQPTTNKMFQIACNQLEFDVLSLNMTEKLPFYFKTHPINCVSKGVQKYQWRGVGWHSYIKLLTVAKKQQQQQQQNKTKQNTVIMFRGKKSANFKKMCHF